MVLYSKEIDDRITPRECLKYIVILAIILLLMSAFDKAKTYIRRIMKNKKHEISKMNSI